MVLSIKNMVCPRCIAAVRGAAERLGYTVADVRLGEAEIAPDPDAEGLERLRGELEALGFELLDDRRAQLVERIKTAVIELVHYDDKPLKVNLSDWLTERTGIDYASSSRLFSEMCGITIEKYFIAQKIERVKELLVYDRMTLAQIADAVGYSSTAHLSRQFKSVTGLTPSHFKRIGASRRRPLDEI